MMVMKGLPLAYSKDMQEDKEMAFDALDNFSLMVAAMTGMIEDLKPNKDKMKEAAAHGYSTATDLADWLVRALNMPFRDAHHVTGEIVALAEKQQKRLDELSLEEMQHGGTCHQKRHPRRAFGRSIRHVPHELWWHISHKCQKNGPDLARETGKAGINQLRKGFKCNFLSAKGR